MESDTLHIALFQLDLVWENPQANREMMDDWFPKLDPSTDLVFLPEMFSTGFSMNGTQLAETMEGETVQWMKRISAQYQFALCGSLIISQNGQYFNRLVFVEPSGEVHFYNKRHLFTMDHEERHFQRGRERIIVNYKGWRICPLICYDLRFPVWSRNRNEYDVLVYVANWPNARLDVWNTLLKARAIENQCYVVGVNRVGVDGSQIEYTGGTQVIDPKGRLLVTAVNPGEELLYALLSLEEMTLFRAKFPVLDDADDFDLK